MFSDHNYSALKRSALNNLSKEAAAYIKIFCNLQWNNVFSTLRCWYRVSDKSLFVNQSLSPHLFIRICAKIIRQTSQSQQRSQLLSEIQSDEKHHKGGWVSQRSWNMFRKASVPLLSNVSGSLWQGLWWYGLRYWGVFWSGKCYTYSTTSPGSFSFFWDFSTK